MALERETVIFFDIRNFSVHRLTLGRHQHARVMTEFVKRMLNQAVTILKRYAPLVGNDSEPLLTHTGDGFVLVVRGHANPVLAVLWISKFQQVMAIQIEEYRKHIQTLLGAHELPGLDYGIGVHHGPISTFTFKSFNDKKNRESRIGFLGTPANIASRVEQSTKDGRWKALCTKRVMDAALARISEKFKDILAGQFTFAGAPTLRGIPGSYRLYALTGPFHRVFKHTMLTSVRKRSAAK